MRLAGKTVNKIEIKDIPNRPLCMINWSWLGILYLKELDYTLSFIEFE